MTTVVPLFDSVDDVRRQLAEQGYLADRATATVIFLADRLGRPVLVEGPAGVGKTELARALAAAAQAAFHRLQCYEGVDEARALYEWNHAKQILRIQSGQAAAAAAGASETWEDTRADVFSDEFLLPRPLLSALRHDGPAVLLVDEIDKADVEIEGLLLEILSDFAVTIPELGTVVASRPPLTLLTSNATRELSEAIKRRCLYLHLDFPDAEREKAILAARVPDLPEALAEQLIRTVRTLRDLDLAKSPSVAESIDWARTLVVLGLAADPDHPEKLDDATIASTLGVILKDVKDHRRAASALRLFQ